MIAPLLLIGLLGLMLAKRGSSSSAPATPKTPGDIAERIVKETQEIIDGKREEYSEDPADVQAELERARQAVQLAQQKEAQTPAPSSSSSAPRMTVGPVQVRKPAPKPAPKPMAKPAAKPAAAAPPAPAGTDLALAKQTSEKLAAHLKAAGRDKYDRKVLKLWQTRAGIPADGVYGRAAAAALRYFTRSAPAAFFAQGVASYTPPKA